LDKVCLKGKQSDCVSRVDKKLKAIPKVTMATESSKHLCRAAFALSNNYRKLNGLEWRDYYSQMAAITER
jgi:hypothetical protein